MSDLIAQLLDVQDSEPIPCSCGWQLLLEDALRSAYEALQRVEKDGVALDAMIEILAILRALQDARE